jgi:hypothetical protein
LLKAHRKNSLHAAATANSWEQKFAFCTVVFAALLGCSHERPPSPAPARSTAPALDSGPPPAAPVEAPKPVEAGPYRARLGRSAELYIPPWFTAKNGGYDLIIHFHGEGRWQEANIEHAKLDVAIVSVNLGAGTGPYANGFKSPTAFDRLLADTQTEITKSGRADGARLRRLALSAWSAGFSSISSLMTDDVAQRVDAILLADGFFTNFTNQKKRTVNVRGLEKFVRFAEAARKDDKLFAITHTTIPTGPYPSVQECVAKLLELIATKKTRSVAIGPRKMRQFYVVDKGSFHIRGFEGTRAADHVRQLHAMGETVYPYLKARWDKQDAEAAAAAAANGGSTPAAPTPEGGVTSASR